MCNLWDATKLIMDTEIQKKTGFVQHILILLGILLICLPPLWVSRDRQYLRVMEDFTISSAQETWLRQQGTAAIEQDHDAWKIPTINGQPRLRKPPLTIWLHMLVWMDLTPEEVTPTDLAARARLLAGFMLLLTIAGTYWAGAVLGGKRLAVIAALCVGTMWFAQREGRTDAYDIHLTAFATLSIAAFLWATQPRQPSARIRPALVGYMLSGVFLGCAWMSKGPLACVVILLPLVVLTPFISTRKRRDFSGLLLVAGISALVALPWYAYLLTHVPQAKDVLVNEYRSLKEYQSIYYYAALLGLIMPWGVWLIAAVIHPFTVSKGRERALRLVPWLWFIIIFIFFSIPETKQQRYILPIIPAVALMIAWVFIDHDNNKTEAMANRKSRILMYLHWGLLICLSVLLGPFLILSERLCASGVMKPNEFAALSPFIAILVGLAALTVSVAGLRRHRKGFAYQAALLTAVWMLICSTAAWYGYKKYEVADEVIQSAMVHDVVGNHPVYCLEPTERRDTFLLYWGCEKFLFYLQRFAATVTFQELEEGITEETHFVMCADQSELNDQVKSAGYQPVLSFSPTDGRYAVLWQSGE